MAIAAGEGRFNRTNDGGGDWWSQNQPPAGGSPGNPGGNPGNPGGQTYGAGQFPGLSQLGISGDPNDPQTIRAFINNRVMATKGHPATEDDYKYWGDNIQRVGGLGDGKFWFDKMTDPSGTGANTGGAGGGGGGGFGGADVMQQDPGYQFALQQGIDAVQHGAAARGTLLTGGAQKDLAQYAAGLASQRYGDIFNRNLSLAQLGLNAAGGQANLGTSYSGQATSALEGQGNAAAAGSLQQGNIWGNTLGNLGNLGAYYAGGGFGSTTGGPNWTQAELAQGFQGPTR
jgi:hypothetical protein